MKHEMEFFDASKDGKDFSRFGEDRVLPALFLGGSSISITMPLALITPWLLLIIPTVFFLAYMAVPVLVKTHKYHGIDSEDHRLALSAYDKAPAEVKAHIPLFREDITHMSDDEAMNVMFKIERVTKQQKELAYLENLRPELYQSTISELEMVSEEQGMIIQHVKERLAIES